MKKMRLHAVLFAAVLQVLPLCRTISIAPAASSTFAIILRWTVGAAATLGAVDAVSGASGVIFTSPTNATAYVGVPFTFLITITNYGSDPGARIAAAPLPPGFTNYTVDLPNANPPDVHGVISCPNPTTPTNLTVFLVATHPSFPGASSTNLYLRVVAASAIAITNQPASQTVLAGGNATFSVSCTGSPLYYQWRRFGTNLAGATNRTLTLTGVRTNQAGLYTVVVTNSINSVTSSPDAVLTVNVPPAPALATQPVASNLFVLSFNPVAGLTNTVQTNDTIAATGWGTLTNIPPPTNTNLISITNPITGPARFYRTVFAP